MYIVRYRIYLPSVVHLHVLCIVFSSELFPVTNLFAYFV